MHTRTERLRGDPDEEHHESSNVLNFQGTAVTTHRENTREEETNAHRSLKASVQPRQQVSAPLADCWKLEFAAGCRRHRESGSLNLFARLLTAFSPGGALHLSGTRPGFSASKTSLPARRPCFSRRVPAAAMLAGGRRGFPHFSCRRCSSNPQLSVVTGERPQEQTAVSEHDHEESGQAPTHINMDGVRVDLGSRQQADALDFLQTLLTTWTGKYGRHSITRMLPFGSRTTGFGELTSDLDMALAVCERDDRTGSTRAYDFKEFGIIVLEQISEYLKQNGWTDYDLDKAKMGAKIPVLTVSLRCLNVDITVNNDLEKLEHHSKNLRKVSNIEVKDGLTVADLWKKIKHTVDSYELLGPNFSQSGGVPTTFPSFQFILMLLEFLKAKRSIDLGRDDVGIVEVRVLEAKASESVEELHEDFFRYYQWLFQSKLDWFELVQVHSNHNGYSVFVKDPWELKPGAPQWKQVRLGKISRAFSDVISSIEKEKALA